MERAGLEYTTKYDIPEYTEFLLALMYQELGNSQTLDIMQSSESIGLPPNAIQDPIMSVNLGVQHFKSVLEEEKKRESIFQRLYKPIISVQVI